MILLRILGAILVIPALWIGGALFGMLFSRDLAFILAVVGMVLGCKLAVYLVMGGAE